MVTPSYSGPKQKNISDIFFSFLSHLIYQQILFLKYIFKQSTSLHVYHFLSRYDLTCLRILNEPPYQSSCFHPCDIKIHCQVSNHKFLNLFFKFKFSYPTLVFLLMQIMSLLFLKCSSDFLSY